MRRLTRVRSWNENIMLEILLLVGMCTYIGKTLRAKGRKPLRYQIGVVAGYYGGVLMAGVVYGILIVVNGGEVLEHSTTTALIAVVTGTAVSVSVVLSALMASPNPTLAQQQFEAGGQHGPENEFAYQESSTNPYAASRYPAG